MAIEKDYYALDKAAEQLGCNKSDLIHLAANGDLSIYLLAKGWIVELYCRANDEAQWKLLDPPDGQQRKALGPVRLLLEDARLLEADSQASTRRFGARLDEPVPEGIYEYRLCETANGQAQPDVRIMDCELVIFSMQLNKLSDKLPGEQAGNTNGDFDRPVGWRERTKLLCIIYALTKEAGIDISHPSKAATVIQGLTIDLGCKVGLKTIEEHLKRIPEALQRGSD